MRSRCAPSSSGIEPYGAPQLGRAASCSTSTRTRTRRRAQVVADIAAAVAEAAAGLNRYPDRDFTALRADLADYLLVESGVALAPEQVWAANGSNEIMLHVLQAFGGPGRTALSFAPTYSMYPEYARDTLTGVGRRPPRGGLRARPRRRRAAIAEHAPSVVLLASPNNPTGTALPADDRPGRARRGGRSVPGGCVVVVDEAYGEFRRTGTPSALELLADHPHLAVSRTMSKAFGLAGARVGYLAASTGPRRRARAWSGCRTTCPP